MALIEKLRAIGDAIRAKSGKGRPLTLTEMADEIQALSAGDGEVPAPYVDSSQITSLRYFGYKGANASLFQDAHFDTSNVTDFTGCFESCPLEKLPSRLDTSSAVEISDMFYRCEEESIFNYGKDISYLHLDLTHATNAHSMFSTAGYGKIPTLENYHNLEILERMFYQSTFITEVCLPNTTKAKTFANAFEGCQRLVKLEIDMSSATAYQNAFKNTTALTDLTIGSVKICDNLFALDTSPSLTVESLVGVLNAFQDNSGGTTYTVYLGSANLAKLTDEQKQIAIAKNILLA